MVARGGLARVRPFTWLPPAVTSGAPCLRNFSGSSRGRALERLPRLQPLSADLGGACSKIARTPWRAWRHPSASGEIGRYAGPGPKTFPMELHTALNRVHKLAGFVYGDYRLRRDKRGDSYLEIDLLRLRPLGTRLQPLGDAPLPVRAGARPAHFIGLRHAPRGLPAVRHARGREPPVGRQQVALDKCLRPVSDQLAKRLSWQNTARIFGTAWDTVHRAAGMAVD